MKKYTIQPGENTITSSVLPSKVVGEFDVKVKVKAVSLNYRDILNLKFADKEIIPFSDGAGEVIEIGSKVNGLKVGDRVVGLFFPTWFDGPITQSINDVARGGGSTDGMLATEVVGHQDSFIAFPQHLSYEEAATLPCAGLTAWHGLFEHAQPAQKGQTVLIQGTGGVSVFSLQIAAAHGLNTIVLSSSDEKLARAKELGATHTINYRRTPDWDDEVLALTDNKGVDLVLEVGGAGTLEKSMRAVKVAGAISVIGGLSGLDAKVNPLTIAGKSLQINGIHVGSRAMQCRFHCAIEQHLIKPVIDTVFNFEQANDAYQHQLAAQHFGKVIVNVA